MMLKITERCSMGCSHCMNDARPNGKDMPFSVLQDSLAFLKNNNLAKESLLITGGEPTEHSDFDLFMDEIIVSGQRHFFSITVLTNGEEIIKDPAKFQNHIQRAADARIQLAFQVSADTRYYPRRIPVHKRIFREPGFILCDNCVERIYPQGRALTNQIPWESKASKCFNVRALSHQLPKDCTLRDIELALFSRLKFCTPHIGIDGAIKLGESDLCPVCASIYDSMDEIMFKIRNFNCNSCNHINKRLPYEYKNLL